MRLLYIIMFLCVSMVSSGVFAGGQAPGESLSPGEKKMIKTCNLEARNSLVNGDVDLVEKVCTRAIDALDKSHENKELLVNSIMNMAFAYTLAGRFKEAEPLYDRAKQIRADKYGHDSKEVQEIERMISVQEAMKKKALQHQSE